MICLSKADEFVFRHLSWNQSPSPLAAAQTTRQDLNGIANLREHVDADQDDGSGGCSGGSLGTGDEKNHLGIQPPEPSRGELADARRLSRSAGILSLFSPFFSNHLYHLTPHILRVTCPPLIINHLKACPLTLTLGLSSCLKTVDGGDDHDRLSRGTAPSCLSRVWSWAAWVLSVLVVSSIISSWNSPNPVAVSSPLVQRSLPPAQASPLSKRSTCDAGGVNKNDYNTGLHVAALFIILCVSTLACAFPVLAVKFPGLRIPSRFFFAVRHFGTGVLIATAFVHLLPTAFISLGDPCLGGFWTNDYPAIPGAIALAAIFFVTIIEMVFHPSRHLPTNQMGPSSGDAPSDNEPRSHGGCMGSVGMLPVRDMGPLRGRASSIGHGLTILNSREMPRVTDANETSGQEGSTQPRRKQSFEETSLESVHVILTPEQKQRKELLQCVLLELGILFHSVFIGMALSVSTGNEFIILLIAIVFHRKLDS